MIATRAELAPSPGRGHRPGCFQDARPSAVPAGDDHQGTLFMNRIRWTAGALLLGVNLVGGCSSMSSDCSGGMCGGGGGGFLSRLFQPRSAAIVTEAPCCDSGSCCGGG